MTFRILYWGSPLFLLGFRPDEAAEAAFFESYYANSIPASSPLLSYFLVKEQIKHWDTAIKSLEMRPWPAIFKQLLAATYVNPYYNRALANELKKAVS